MKPTVKGLLSEEIPSFEEFIIEEELPPLNLKLIIECVSSVPLYERLDIDIESLCDNETKLMELQAKEYNGKMNNITGDKKIDFREDNLSISESEYSQDEDFFDIFLKNLYNCSDNDELLISVKENITFNEAIQESAEKVNWIDGFEVFTPSKEFSQFLLNANDGKHDNLVVHEVLFSQGMSSDISSDEKDEIRDEKIKELSYKLKFYDSSNSEFLEPIINLNTFKIISESNCKITTLKKDEIFVSDSECDDDLNKKHKTFEVDKTSKNHLPYRAKKDVRFSKKKREEDNTKESNIHLKKNNKSKSVLMKFKEKTKIKNIHGSRSHSDISSADQDQISVESLIAPPASTNDLVNLRQLININDNFKKKQVHNETSSSDDEDWKDLAEKNLFLRSKTLEQKATMKR